MTARPMEILSRHKWPALGLALCGLLLGVLPPVLPTYILMLLTQGMIYGIVAMSLDILVGYLGLAALGHAAYFAIGGYTTAILMTRWGASFWTGLLWSVGVTGAIAAAVGLLALRATGVYFLLITLAIAMSFWGLIHRWVSLTGADNGIAEIPRPGSLGPVDFSDPVLFHYFILLVFAAVLALIFMFLRSPFGKTLVGIRDNEARMRVLGYNTWLHKYIAFILAGATAGVSGAFFATFNGFIGPDECSLTQCMDILLMVSIGGQGTLVGANIGAFLVTFLKNLLSVYTKRWLMVMAVLYILCAKYAPNGLIGLWRRLQRGGAA
jgi:branched-chain amino acid transport system permease protein